MQTNLKTKDRDACSKDKSYPKTSFCSSETEPNLDTCVGEVGSALICDGRELRGIISKTCNDGDDGITEYTDVSQLFNWIVLQHLDETLKLVDSDFLKYILFGTLDFFAYYIDTPKVADNFEIIKFLF